MSLYVNIEKQFGAFHLKMSFEAENEVLALLGASGCGKSMTLKCIAGIEKPDKGLIVVDGVTLFDSEKKINLSPQERHTGLLFQNYALFPNMTVEQNIRAGARREKDATKRERMTAEIMHSFALTPLAKHYPHQLSGGQQQRTALARILVSSPSILLLDEPFSALDSHLRFRLEREVHEVIRGFGKSVVLVSHNRDKVFRLSDKIAVMSDGAVDSIGEKNDLFASPRTVTAAIMTGCKNISRIERLGANRVRALDWGVELTTAALADDTTSAGIRMHDIRAGDGENAYECEVVDVIENPFSYTVMLKPQNAGCASPIGWELEKSEWRTIAAERVKVSLPADRISLLKDTEKG